MTNLINGLVGQTGTRAGMHGIHGIDGKDLTVNRDGAGLQPVPNDK